jgi:hypothetical protein
MMWIDFHVPDASRSCVDRGVPPGGQNKSVAYGIGIGAVCLLFLAELQALLNPVRLSLLELARTSRIHLVLKKEHFGL